MRPTPRNQIWIPLVISSLIVFGCIQSRVSESALSTGPEMAGSENSDYGVNIQTLKEEALGEVRSKIALAEAAGAKKITPRTYAQTIEMLKSIEAFISINPNAREEIETMADEALFEANRLLVITEQGKQAKKMKPEEVVLMMEKQLQTITETIGAQDMRNRKPRIQLDNILDSIKFLQEERTDLSEKVQSQQSKIEALQADYQTKIDSLNVRLATLEDRSLEDRMAKDRMATDRMAIEKHLAAEKLFNQRFLTVRAYFQVDEAEVYKHESQLIIRLKAMHFQVGKSIIASENYELLGKVQKAIHTFEDPRVIVEGHTDATGSEARNMELSQQRAEAVSHYMIANKTLPPENISAVGYGSGRPLASNNTSAGRAINRRIDIIIIPETHPM